MILPTKFWVSWCLGSGDEGQNRSSRWPPWRPSWNSNRNNFSYIWSTCYPDASYKFWSNGLSIQKKKRKIDFQDGGHLGFLIRTILAIFDLQITIILHTKFESVVLSVQETKRAKKDFQDGHRGGHLGFPIGMILAIFDLQVTLILPTKFWVNWLRGVRGVGF